MMHSSLATHQREQYEAIYGVVDSEYGFPDRKIEDGHLLKCKKILSLGSGTGIDVWHLAEENLVVGLDYAMSGLRIGRDHKVQGVMGDLNLRLALPFEDRSFDVIICKDILEHLLEPLAALVEARRVLKDDGYVVVSVPNHFCFPMRLRILFGKGLIWKSITADHGRDYREWNYMHIRFFTYKGFRQFLKAAGLHPEKWFWDFGDLAHYRNPDMYLEPQLWKKAHGRPVSRRGKLGLYVIRPLWKVFNFLFPLSWRRAIVSLAPGLLCSGFYARCVKDKPKAG